MCQYESNRKSVNRVKGNTKKNTDELINSSFLRRLKHNKISYKMDNIFQAACTNSVPSFKIYCYKEEGSNISGHTL